MSTMHNHLTNGDHHRANRTPDHGDMEKQFLDAKNFILSATTKNGVNLYDHLTHCISRLLTEQPRDPVGIFEDVSVKVKDPSSTARDEATQDQTGGHSEHNLAEEQKPLFEKTDNTEELDDEALQSPLPNLLQQAYFFEQAGIGLGRDETYRIWLSLKQLMDKAHFESLRFWGKIFGTEKNYYIAEAQLNADEEADADDEEGAEEANAAEEEKDEDEEGEGEEDPLPKSAYKPPPTVPKEERGNGVNKKTYYVCNYPGAPWVKLPIVLPAQIAQARQVKFVFTGDLSRPINAYPAYPGTEKNYLRAQIARISATTHVAPSGRFKFSDEEEEAEEEGGRENYQDDEDFKGAPLSQLIDEELTGWVHIVQHILPQGRTKWWNPNENANNEEEENEEEEEDNKGEKQEYEPEHGPPLLTPIGSDIEIQSTKAWTTKISSHLIPQYACAYVRSNLWPGAYAFARGTVWENIYVGYGHKYTTDDYSPILPPMPAPEFQDTSDINEADDPTPEDEAKARAAEEHPDEEGDEEQAEEVDNGEDDD